MTTTFQTLSVTPIAEARARVVASAVFNAQTDYTDWVQMGAGLVQFQATGPVDAATINLARSTTDPSGVPNTTVVATATGNAGTVGVAGSFTNAAPAWFRLQNAATFGPAASVTARTLAALAGAINGWDPATWGFAAGTDSVPTVNATYTATTLTVTAITPGAAGNSIATGQTLTNGTWAGDDVTLQGGADAVAAEGTLTFTDVGNAGDEIVIGDVTYTLVAALTGAAGEVLIGGDVEGTRDNLLDAINGEGTLATGILTASANPAAGSTVRLGQYQYTFVENLTAVSTPFEVLIGAAATNSLDNLIAAINSGAGAGTTYGYNTPPNPDASAAAGAGDTIDVTSRYSGADANLIISAELSSQLSWGAAQLTGATGAGVTYDADLEAHSEVEGAANSTDAIDVTALVAGVAGNAIATTTDSSEASWGATELENGADAVAASLVLTMSGAFANNNTVTVGDEVYTIKTTLTPAANEIMIAGTQVTVNLIGERSANV